VVNVAENSRKVESGANILPEDSYKEPKHAIK
jgi:hypothetical protein